MQTRENPCLVADRTIAVTDRTLNSLILELDSECQTNHLETLPDDDELY